MSSDPVQSIRFERLTQQYLNTLFSWLDEPHMQEFWDNSPEHRADIINFIEGRQTPSNYFNGVISYWVGLINEDPFCFILTAKVNKEDDSPEIWQQHLSKTGTTYSLDFGIGNKHYLGKKLAAPALNLFTQFFQQNIDHTADTFCIDPAQDNPRAIHVYEQAGFKKVGNYLVDIGVFSGETSELMVMSGPIFPEQ